MNYFRIPFRFKFVISVVIVADSDTIPDRNEHSSGGLSGDSVSDEVHAGQYVIYLTNRQGCYKEATDKKGILQKYRKEKCFTICENI